MIRCNDGRDFPFQPNTTALLVTDMQRDFLDPGGMAAVEGEPVERLRAVMLNVSEVTRAARAAGVEVIHTREGYAADLSDVSAMKAERGSVGAPGPLGRFLIRGERGHDFHGGFGPAGRRSGYRQARVQCLLPHRPRRAEQRHGITHLLICGITTQCCVHSTLRDAVDRGFYCLTVADACAAFDPEVHEAVLRIIQAESSLFGWIADTEEVVGSLE
ncbi:MAG: cysteine hydrolase family protein [Acidimicrobiia bacterium]|nr:cysteine hydrolase family protein [Acidimicrobiia bacterium]